MVDQAEKKQVAVRIPLREKAELEREAEEQDTSRSEYIRNVLRKRDRADELAKRLEIREARIDDLEEQLARRSQVEEKVDVLAERVDHAEGPEPPWPVRWWRWVRGSA